MKKSKTNIYQLPVYEVVIVALILGIAMMGISLLFFDSIWGLIALSVPYGMLFREFMKEREAVRKKDAVAEFKEFLENLSSNLYAGMSFEHSFVNAYVQTKKLFLKHFVLEQPLINAKEKLQNHVPMEEVLFQFAEQAMLDEIWDFATLTSIAKRKGGNLMKIIRQANDHIGERMRLEQEIATVTAAKRLEQSIMCVMPFLMMIYMKFTNESYFEVLYHNPMGILFMSVCLFVIFIAYKLGTKIVRNAL